MTLPIAVQLYSVREQLAKDFAGTLREISAMGYVGAETAGVPAGMTAHDVKQLLSDLGMQVVSAHVPLPLKDKLAEGIEQVQGLGTKQAVCAWLDPKVYFQDMDGIKRACDLLNEANAAYRAQGLTLHYHNHHFEFTQIAGRPALHHMLEMLEPTVQIELDIYWAQTGGADPLATLAMLGGRSTLLHIKDGPCTLEASMVAVGAGKVDYKRIIPAVQNTAHWLIVELDRTDGDMIEAVRGSYQYLVGEGLAHGRP